MTRRVTYLPADIAEEHTYYTARWMIALLATMTVVGVGVGAVVALLVVAYRAGAI